MNDKIVSIEELRRRAEARSLGTGAAGSPDSAADDPGSGTATAEDAGSPQEAPPRPDGDSASSPNVRPVASEIERLAAEFREEMGDLPDVRADKIIEAKLRISQGYYTRERIAEGLLESWLGPDPEGPGTPAAGPRSHGESADPADGDAAYDERT